MAIEVFNRYEHKYLLDEDTCCKVLMVMDKYRVLGLDAGADNYLVKTFTLAQFLHSALFSDSIQKEL